MKTRKVKIPTGLDHHAIMAWCFMGEAVRKCGGKAAADYEFMCLLRDLHDAYPKEYEFFLAAERGEV